MQGYCEKCRKTCGISVKVTLVEDAKTGKRRNVKENRCSICNSPDIKPLLME